ncbi:MAG: arginyltransferase [Gammaproteobacteria bacterium]|nr:arginyltransferase [Gammaproteobacteria bacterium]
MSKIKLYQTPEHDCPYLDGEKAVTQFIDPVRIPDDQMYTHLSRLGFRRSGEYLYRPSCPSCDSCISVRIPIEKMTFSKNQKRCLARAQHFEYIHFNAVDSDEHYELYESYINKRHKGGDMHPATRELFKSFLLSNWADNQFMEIRDDSRLIACAVYDKLIDGLSAVYCYFDSEYNRFSPGKLAILKQIQFAKTNGLEYLYLGYQINQCSKMNYKTNYRPVEQFINKQWQR